MKSTTRRVAALTATLITAAVLASCSSDPAPADAPAETWQEPVATEYPDGSYVPGGHQDPNADDSLANATDGEPLVADYGQMVNLPDGLGALAISEPVAGTVNNSEYLGELEKADGVTVEVSYTNGTDGPVDAVESFDYLAWSGNGEGEWASPGDGSEDPNEFHLMVPAGKTATWTQYWVVEDPADVTFMVSPSLLGDLEQTWALTIGG